MPITALPEATVRLLGSAQVLTTPASLVKELVENAIDAKATSIDILISKNTLDKLEVRDNGHGIPTEDFDALGRRGHTSKLRSFEELKFRGGVTLGFRGEALASAVQLGKTSITTKTEGELVATKLVLKSSGGVDSQTSTSHPVGTTVTVLTFMAKLPVRKTIFEKEAPRTLAKINQLLRSYAFARPSIRFSLKITDGSKGSWSFAPRPNDGIREAVSQLIGRDAALECIEKSLVFTEMQSRNIPQHDERHDASDICSEINAPHDSEYGYFVVQAFLPKPDANPSKLGTGQYLSVDSRPVSFEKGTMKKVVTLFKKYVRGALVDTSEKLKSPLICLNIKCPVASYDANVEPAKDDVLFGNEHLVLELAEKLLKDVYGECKAVPTACTPKQLAQKLEGFEVLLARKPALASGTLPPIPTAISRPLLSPGSSGPAIESGSPMTEGSATTEQSFVIERGENGNEQTSLKGQQYGFGVSMNYSEEFEDVVRPDRPCKYIKPSRQQTPEREMSAAKLLNPWIIAKLNAPSGPDHATTAQNCNTLPVTATEFSPSAEQDDQQVRSSDTLGSPRQTFYTPDVRSSQLPVVNAIDQRLAFPNSHGYEDEILLSDANLPYHLDVGMVLLLQEMSQKRISCHHQLLNSGQDLVEPGDQIDHLLRLSGLK